MILANLTRAIREQNYYAVVLEFLIVIAGVVIGFQITAWNEDRNSRRLYDEAIARFIHESEENIEILNTLHQEITDRIEQVDQGYLALTSCFDSEENRRLVALAVSRIGGSIGLILRDQALNELTENQQLQSQQSDDERAVFSDLRFELSVIVSEAGYMERLPLERRPYYHPAFQSGHIQTSMGVYTGIEIADSTYSLNLIEPINTFCTDNELLKDFYNWRGWQGQLPGLIAAASQAIESTLEELS